MNRYVDKKYPDYPLVPEILQQNTPIVVQNY